MKIIRTPSGKNAATEHPGRNFQTRLVGTFSPLQQSPFATSNAWEAVGQFEPSVALQRGQKRKREGEPSELSRPSSIRKMNDAAIVSSTRINRRKSKGWIVFLTVNEY